MRTLLLTLTLTLTTYSICFAADEERGETSGDYHSINSGDQNVEKAKIRAAMVLWLHNGGSYRDVKTAIKFSTLSQEQILETIDSFLNNLPSFASEKSWIRLAFHLEMLFAFIYGMSDGDVPSLAYIVAAIGGVILVPTLIRIIVAYVQKRYILGSIKHKTH